MAQQSGDLRERVLTARRRSRKISPPIVKRPLFSVLRSPVSHLFSNTCKRLPWFSDTCGE